MIRRVAPRVRDLVLRCRVGSSRLFLERVGVDLARRLPRSPASYLDAPPTDDIDARLAANSLMSDVHDRVRGQIDPPLDEIDAFERRLASVFGQFVSLDAWMNEDTETPGPLLSDLRTLLELARLGHLVAPVTNRPPNSSAHAIAFEVLRFLARLPDADVRRGQPLDASLRIFHCVQLLKNAECGPGLRSALMREARRSSNELWKHREVGPIRSNHFLGNLLGLAASTLVLDHGPAQRNQRYVERHLGTEIEHQMLPDGVFHEGSTFYHKLCTEMLAALLMLMGAGWDRDLTANLRLALDRSWTALSTIVWRNGDVPLFGDSDSAQVLRTFGNEPNRTAELAATAAALLDQSTAPGAESFGTILLPASGIVAATFGRCEVRLDLGPIGLRGFGGHGHADFGSLVVRFDDDDLVVDTGTSVYTRDLDRRYFERSSAAHNMTTVAAEQYQLDRSAPFQISAEQLRTDRWVDTGEGFARLFARLANDGTGIVVERQVTITQSNDGVSVNILDSGAGLGTQALMTTWTVAGACEIGVRTPPRFGQQQPTLYCSGGSAEQRSGTYSLRFGELLPATTVVCSADPNADGAAALTTEILLPETGGGTDQP